MKINYDKLMWTILWIMSLIGLCSLMYLLGFGKGYTSDNTKHEFIFDIGEEAQQITEAMQNLSLRLAPSNHTCMEGCHYAFYGIASDKNVWAIGSFNVNKCKTYCEE